MSKKPLRSQARNIVYHVYNKICEEGGVSETQSAIFNRVFQLTGLKFPTITVAMALLAQSLREMDSNSATCSRVSASIDSISEALSEFFGQNPYIKGLRMFYSAKCKEDPENEEQEMEDRPPARHKLPQTMTYSYAAAARARALEPDAVPVDENVIVEKWVTPEQMLEDLLYTPVASPGINRDYEENILPYSRRFAKDLMLPRRVDWRYLRKLKAMRCLELSSFNDSMFTTRFGRMVNMVCPWESKLWNLNNSLNLSRLSFDYQYDGETGLMNLLIKDDIFAQAIGSTRRRARKNVARVAWDIIRRECVTILTKPMAIAFNQIFTSNDVIARPVEVFQTWFGASTPTNLGANWQGIVEPIRPNARVVIRRGKQSPDFTLETWQAAFITLMERYIIADTMDMDLIFNSDFTEEERTMMYETARRLGLVTRNTESNGFSSLLVKRRFDPFTIARRVIAKGGDTPKYQAFVPTGVRFIF